MGKIGFRTVAGLVFGLISILQAVRAALQVPVQIGSTYVPFVASWIACLIFAILAIWAFRPSSG
jgi:hypothetical protein